LECEFCKEEIEPEEQFVFIVNPAKSDIEGDLIQDMSFYENQQYYHINCYNNGPGFSGEQEEIYDMVSTPETRIIDPSDLCSALQDLGEKVKMGEVQDFLIRNEVMSMKEAIQLWLTTKKSV
jgi:hypothetical protein